MTKRKNKNISQKNPNGRTLQTRDEYFYGAANYKKPGYQKKGKYRKVVVVDSNRDDELAVVKLTTSNAISAKPLPTYQKGKSKYKPYVETKNHKGKPIKPGVYFSENKPSLDVDKKSVNQIKEDCMQSSRNRFKLRKLKKR